MIKTIRFVKTVTMNVETNEIISVVESVETDTNSVTTKDQKSKKSVSKVMNVSENDIELLNGKFQLSNESIEKLNASVGDRIGINYINKDGEFYPVISRSAVFGDPESGNKLTKSLTVSFKGKQLESLKQYGSKFSLIKDETLPEGVFKLVDPSDRKSVV